MSQRASNHFQMPPESLTGLSRDLLKLEEAGKEVIIGLIGAGEMGTDLIMQVARMRGLRIGAVAVRNAQNALKAVEIAYGDRSNSVVCESDAAITKAIEMGKIAICTDASLIANNPLIQQVVEATGKPSVGADIGLQALEAGKHLIMMNVEADVTVGAYLKRRARELGLIYTVGAGDEPSSIMELVDFANALGLPIVSAGKGKNNPLNLDAVPDDYAAEAKARNMNPRMLVEFVDGSKTMVEMAALANATGLVPDKPGMHGPEATLDNLEDILIPEWDGGILSDVGRVDYTIGKGVAPGVFVIVKAPHERIHERMADLKVGRGPYFTLYRPFHLTSLEVPLSCARVALYGQVDMQPLDVPVAEVCALAKKDMRQGEKFDAIGQYCYRSWTMTVADARKEDGVPCGLIEGGVATAPIRKGELITYKNCSPDNGLAIVGLRTKQDLLLRN
ncbi:NAD(P)H-dependent oxidoreductase [Maritalea sp.]|uniref:NAD(P)H-dependent oxidoreductase n=1 Tax=Maritalea sp. TaxID=2003361 RepID=UPI003EF15FED